MYSNLNSIFNYRTPESGSSSHRHQYSSLDVSLTLLSCHYPRKLMKHLKQERKIPVAKISDGVCYINKEAFHIQIIVTKELSPEGNLYLRCLTGNLQDAALASRLTDDYRLHQEQEIYIKYLHQVSTANFKKRKDTKLWFLLLTLFCHYNKRGNVFAMA